MLSQAPSTAIASSIGSPINAKCSFDKELTCILFFQRIDNWID